MNAAIIVIERLAQVYIVLIFARVIMSWFRSGASSFLGRIIMQTTQPIFDLIRKMFPRTTWGMIDFSPIIAFLLVDFIRYILILIISSYF
ncbi:MAG: YggT family protein [Candidatus Gracilibacteria bacterium]|nr:YggT family protein [Candidatus Gracilibacteria bacterium]